MGDLQREATKMVGSETGAKWVGGRQGVGRKSRGSGVSDSQVRMKFHAVWGEVTQWVSQLTSCPDHRRLKFLVLLEHPVFLVFPFAVCVCVFQ